MSNGTTTNKCTFHDIVSAVTIGGCTSHKAFTQSFGYHFLPLLGPGRIYYRGEDKISVKRYGIGEINFVFVTHRQEGLATPDDHASDMYCEQRLPFSFTDIYVLRGNIEIRDRDEAIKLICSVTDLKAKDVEAATSNQNQFYRLIAMTSSPLKELLATASRQPEKHGHPAGRGAKAGDDTKKHLRRERQEPETADP